jgi:hypothetical protein
MAEKKRRIKALVGFQDHELQHVESGSVVDVPDGLGQELVHGGRALDAPDEKPVRREPSTPPVVNRDPRPATR